MFPEILTEARSLVLERINSLINAESKVSDSMLYTSTAESKMIRSALLITASKKNTCLTKSSAINLATSIELLHSYSLIHDDLPSMDNDNIRRGKDSNHIKYGEAIAILSGDALQTLAFEVITNDGDLDSDLKVSAISLLTDACGYKGMVLGQELDITAESMQADEEFIKKMHYLKTGKLIEISLVLGFLGYERFSEDKDLIYKLGKSIGVGFQTVDDYLDEFGNQKEIGKPTGSDLKNKKINILSILNEEECLELISENHNESLEIAKKIFDKGNDKEHPLNESRFSEASILISNANFGCGSSREHAPQALYRYGFRAIIAESFAEIFFGNCCGLGVPCAVASHEDINKITDIIDSDPSTEIKLDIVDSTVSVGDLVVSVEIPQAAKDALTHGRWDPIAELQEAEQDVDELVNHLGYLD